MQRTVYEASYPVDGKYVTLDYDDLEVATSAVDAAGEGWITTFRITPNLYGDYNENSSAMRVKHHETGEWKDVNIHGC